MDIDPPSLPEPSVSFSLDGVRFVVETTKDATAGTIIRLIVVERREGCSIWDLVVNEADLPKLGMSSLNARYLIQYILDGKEEKDGCSLKFEKSEDGSEMMVTILEQRCENRPPIKFCFCLRKLAREDKLSTLERLFLYVDKEVVQQVAELRDELHVKNQEIAELQKLKAQDLNAWSLSMSSEFNGFFSNTKDALLDNDLSQGAAASHEKGWIQATFLSQVRINGVYLGIVKGAAWGSRDLNGCEFQCSKDGVSWTTLFVVSGLDEEHNKVKGFLCSATARYFRLLRSEKGCIGVGMMKFH